MLRLYRMVMRLKFMESAPSTLPDFPFRAGQVVVVPELNAMFRGYLKAGTLVIIDEPAAETEAAVLDTPAEVAAEVRPRARGRR
jgi:hypothetical protein